MAEILQHEEVRIEWTDIQKWRAPIPMNKDRARSSGIHLTDILRYLHFGSLPPNASTDEKDKKKAEWDLDDPEVMPLKMVMGLAWEDWLAGLYPEMHYHPGETTRDKIAMSPDGYSVLQDELPLEIVVEEIKLTWKSCRTREVLKENLWMWQLKGYCYAENTVYGRTHVCWVNGDYRHPYQPRYFKTLIRFTSEELERNWAMIVGAKDRSAEWNRVNKILGG